MARLKRYPAAIVSFLNDVEAVSEGDAINVAELLIGQLLRTAASSDGQLAVETRAGVRHAWLGQVCELGRAQSNRLITVSLTTPLHAYTP